VRRGRRLSVDLRRYNEVLWAFIGTAAILGALGLALVLAGSGLFSDPFPDPQVDLREPQVGTRDRHQNLVLCLPTIVAGANTYLIGATVADASEPVSKRILGSGGSYNQRYSPTCTLAGRYGTSGQLQNVLVKDLETGEERLLLPQRALIQRFEAPAEKCETGAGIAPCDRLYWELRPADSNADGSIDAEDAAVAYLSDLRASSLVRVSPEDSNLVSIARDPSRSVLLMQVQLDSNGDSAYTAADSVELFKFAYDSEGRPEPLLSEAARNAVSNVLLP
jgi:hypothetical protein